MPSDTTRDEVTPPHKPKHGEKRRQDAAAVDLPGELNHERACDVNQASAITGLAVDTLAQWRLRGIGPRFFRIGRQIRYRLGDLLAFRDARTVGRKAAP
jgi:hypothetical protein